LHIALFTPSWPPGRYPNGIVTYVKWLREGLVLDGHRVTLVAGTIGEGASGPDLHPVELSLRDRLGRLFGRWIRRRPVTVFDGGQGIASTLKRIHAADPIDVIEMEESFGWIADVADRVKVPLICKLHGPAFLTSTEEELRRPLIQKKIQREGEVLGRMPVIVAPARFTLAQTLSRYGLRPVIAVQSLNPVALGEDAPLWDLSTCDRKAILFVGRFDKLKGADLVVQAFQKLHAAYAELRLIIVGPDVGLLQPDGSISKFERYIDSFGSPSLAAAVSFLGPLEPAEVSRIRASALVSIVCSRFENQSYTALEAMLQGCPLVCTDTAGLSEMVEHGVTGLKARAADPDDLAAQVRRFIEDPEWAGGLGSAGRKWVLEQHSPRTVAAQSVEIYCRAIALRRSAAAPSRLPDASWT
jgi:glycosyltransferase involved in cell wall biosynthesis